MALPLWLFVAEQGEGADKYLNANRDQEAVVEDDGTIQTIGNYKLIKKVRLRKGIEFVVSQPRKRAKR